jgi:hypothetical protein
MGALVPPQSSYRGRPGSAPSGAHNAVTGQMPFLCLSFNKATVNAPHLLRDLPSEHID